MIVRSCHVLLKTRNHAQLCTPRGRRHQWGEDAEPLKRASGVAAGAMLGANGRAPRAGQLQRNPDLAATFRAVAQHGALEGAWAARPTWHPGRAAEHCEPCRGAPGSAMTGAGKMRIFTRACAR